VPIFCEGSHEAHSSIFTPCFLLLGLLAGLVVLTSCQSDAEAQRRNLAHQLTVIEQQTARMRPAPLRPLLSPKAAEFLIKEMGFSEADLDEVRLVYVPHQFLRDITATTLMMATLSRDRTGRTLKNNIACFKPLTQRATVVFTSLETTLYADKPLAILVPLEVPITSDDRDLSLIHELTHWQQQQRPGFPEGRNAKTPAEAFQDPVEQEAYANSARFFKWQRKTSNDLVATVMDSSRPSTIKKALVDHYRKIWPALTAAQTGSPASTSEKGSRLP